MKKYLLLVLVIALAIICISLVGCGKVSVKTDENGDIVVETDKIVLSAPENLRIEQKRLVWNPVANATGYTVNIDGNEYICENNEYSIQNLNRQHTFKVKANGDDIVYLTSNYSSPLTVVLTEGAQTTEARFDQFDDLLKQEAFLGYGFDVINSSIFSAKSGVKKTFMIFDTDELMNLRLLKIDDPHFSVDEIQSESMSDFQQSWNVYMNVDVDWGGSFIGGSVDLEATYSGGSSTAASKYYHSIIISNEKFMIVMQSDLDTFRSILSSGFEQDLYSDMEPSELFDKYGTHFITSAVMGGMIISDYLYTSEEKTSFHEVSAKVSVDVRYMAGSTNVDVGGGYKQEATSRNITITNKIKQIGGSEFGLLSDEDIAPNILEWQKSLDEHPVLMGITDTSSLVPIWDLIDASKDTRTYDWEYLVYDREHPYEEAVLVSGHGSRAQQLQAYFMSYGVTAYNKLMKNAGLRELVTPDYLDNVRVNNETEKNNVFEVYAGTNNQISFNVFPANAVGYTKAISLNKTLDYARVGEDKASVVIDGNAPDGVYVDVTLGAGAARKTIRLHVLQKYTIDFRLNSGAFENEDAIGEYQAIRSGTWIDTLPIPVRAGYTFLGWYTDSAMTEKYEEGPIESDFSLYAKWQKYYPTITYRHNVSGCDFVKENVEYNSKYQNPNIDFYGYDLIGFYKDANMTSPMDETENIIADLTVYVKWEKHTYTVQFEPNGGSAVGNQSVKYLEKIDKTKIATSKIDDVFIGWYKDSSLQLIFDPESDLIENSITLYAKWSSGLDLVEIQFNTNGGDVLGAQLIVEGTSLGQNMRTPTKYGYAFEGWYSDENLTNKVYSTTTFDTNTTLYAKWVLGSYVLTFYDIDGTEITSVEVLFDTVLEDALFVANGLYPLPIQPSGNIGHTFMGWNFSTDRMTPNTTAVAKWSTNVYNINIMYGENIRAVECEFGTYIYDVLKDINLDGYMIAGWKYNEEAVVANGAKMPDEDIVCEAIWSSDKATKQYEEKNTSFSSSAQYDISIETIDLVGNNLNREVLETCAKRVNIQLSGLQGFTAVITDSKGYNIPFTLSDENDDIANFVMSYQDFEDGISVAVKTYSFLSKVNLNVSLQFGTQNISVLRFDCGVGRFNGYSKVTLYTSNNSYNLPTLSANSYEFLGWRGDDGMCYSGSYNIPNESATLNAKWVQYKQTARDSSEVEINDDSPNQRHLKFSNVWDINALKQAGYIRVVVKITLYTKEIDDGYQLICTYMGHNFGTAKSGPTNWDTWDKDWGKYGVHKYIQYEHGRDKKNTAYAQYTFEWTFSLDDLCYNDIRVNEYARGDGNNKYNTKDVVVTVTCTK